MHWADFTAQKLSEIREGPYVSCSGITPSGEFHIGHLREILSAEMIHRACLDAGLNSKYIFIVDSMDPLRRVYSFLSDDYEKYIGCPLAFIPAPDVNGKPDLEGGSYADYFLNPFLDSLKKIGVEPEIIMNHEIYGNGGFSEKIHIAIEKRDQIREIIHSISGRELPEEWFPYNPLGSDGSMDGVTVTKYEYPLVHWTDRHGKSGFADIRKAEGKLPWRIDWAARWGIHGVTCEPAGKDHGAAGGSYDTGIPICRILGFEPPEKMVYEWIQVKGAGPMSSSSGNTIGPVEALNIVPPEIIRYLIAGTKMNKHIDFNTGSALFEIADEYERLVRSPPKENEEMSKRQKVAAATNIGALRLSQIKQGDDPSNSIAGVSFRHLSMLAQIKSEDTQVWQSLVKSGHLKGEPNDALRTRLARMRDWTGSAHFPEDARINIQKVITNEMKENISEDQIKFLKILSNSLSEVEWDNELITESIQECANLSEIKRRDAFLAIYWITLGKSFGPKASSLIFEIGKDEITKLIALI